MANINQSIVNVISTLEHKDLIVDPYGEIGPFSGGYLIAKPESVPGNRRQNYETYLGSEEILCDAPCTRIYPKDGKWIFELWEWVPGPGPGDFQEEYLSINDTVPAILDYYFGDPNKMNPPQLMKQ
jgi:hypothetical protein